MNEFIKALIERLEEKFKYNSEQAEIWREGSDKDAYFREKKDLYLDRANTYGEVIRTVNQLAEEYNNDVCEWKWVENGEFIQNPHTNRKFSHEPSMRNVYCNTCGKKISIVNWLKAEREG